MVVRLGRTRELVAVAIVSALVLSGCSAPATAALRAVLAAPPRPEVASLAPASGSLAGGETIVLTGAHLGAVDRVTFGGTLSPSVSVIDDRHVDVVVPHSYTYTEGAVPVAAYSSTGPAVASTDVDLHYDYRAITGVDRQLQYAFAHWNDYNLAEYGDFTDWGGDCQNFVSQTLVARGWETTDEWYNDAQEDWADAFVSVPFFDDWLSSHPEYGAVRLDGSQRDQLKIGDIAEFDWDNDGSLDHAQVVSGFAVIDGVRHVYLVGHDIDTHYRDLDAALKTEGGPDATVYFWSLPAS